jgi:hypothetical protein
MRCRVADLSEHTADRVTCSMQSHAGGVVPSSQRCVCVYSPVVMLPTSKILFPPRAFESQGFADTFKTLSLLSCVLFVGLRYGIPYFIFDSLPLDRTVSLSLRKVLASFDGRTMRDRRCNMP